jgi:WD40-like Beta Propeller Repeat
LKSTLWAALATALLVLLCGAPMASADSIAYIKDGNVWLSTPDGARQFQVTSTGGYSDVSQADDGTMIASKGVRLHRLDRMGNVTADFDTPVSDTRPAGARTFFGPFDPAISPDGTKVAYTYYYMTQSQNPTCFPPQCVTTINEAGTGYSYADRQTSWDEPGLGYHSGWRHPAWVDNDMTLLANPSHLPNADVILDRISDGGNGHGNLVMNWFSDTVNNPHVGGGDITRDKRKLAFQTGTGDTTLTVYLVRSFPSSWKDSTAVGSDIQRCYRYTAPSGQSYSQPTFSPDGAGLAFGLADGIHIAAVPNFGAECTLDGATPDPPLVIAGGSQPDWGPADVPAARPVTPASPVVTQPSQPSKPSAPSFSASVKRATKSGGIKLSVKVPGRGKLTAVATSGAKTVGKATTTVKKAGTASLKVPVKRRGKLKLKVTFKPTSGASTTKTLSVTVT